MFDRWGTVVTRHRWTTVVIVVGLILGSGLWGAGVFGALSQGGYEDPTSEAVRATEVAAAAGATSSADIIAVYTAPDGQRLGSPAVVEAVTATLADLPAEQVSFVASYWQAQDPSLASADGRSALALITLAGEDSTAKQKSFDVVEPMLDVDGVPTQLAGAVPLEAAVSDQTKSDLLLAEMVSLPIVLVLLLFVFGSVVAALLPVSVGLLSILASLGVLHTLATFTTVSEFAVNVASLLGLGMAIDYGLFVVSRYREELATGAAPADAVRRTLGTAGRTVAFSATLLVIALSTLLLFPQNFLKSVAYGGMAAVALAAAISLTFLPAVLALLGHRIDRLRVGRRDTSPAKESPFWGRLASVVMRRPLLVATPILAVLALLIYPFLGTSFGLPDQRILPADDPSRVAVESLQTQYPALGGEGIQVVLDGSAASAALQSFAADVGAVEGVTSVTPVSPPESPVTVLDVQYDGDVYGDVAGAAVRDIRALDAPDGTELIVGGLTATNLDSLGAIGADLPVMITILVSATLILMFLAFGSVVLPIKAVIMAAVSLSATFGALTWIFVDGHGADLLDVTPQPMEVGIIVLMAAIVFGLSTDYEVFLLSRIVEAHNHGATTEDAVRAGLTKSGRVITAAALLLIVVTGAFSLSGIQMMRFIGIGMIIALTLDATIIRMLLVPALIKMLGNANWWVPGPLRRVQERLALSE